MEVSASGVEKSYWWEIFLCDCISREAILCDGGWETRDSPSYPVLESCGLRNGTKKRAFSRASYCIWSTEPVGYMSAVSSRWKESLLQLL